eukprot:c25253_g2_i2 orf=542-1660(+)
MQTVTGEWLLEGWAGEIRWNAPRTLAVQGCEEILWADEEAFPPSVFGFLGPVYHHTKVPLHKIVNSLIPHRDYRFLLLEFQSCSQLLPLIPSLISFFNAHNFERIALVSHSSCAPGPCLLPHILQALSLSRSFISLVIWGTHSNQLLRLTFTVTHACSHIETYGAQHPPLHDLSFFQALTALHSKRFPQSTHLQLVPICDYILHTLDLISLNFTDCVGGLPDAIHAWLTFNVQKALNLQSIVLSNNGIDDTGALKIISALRLNENNKLRILDLSHNRIESNGVTYLASALTTNTTLRHLYLGGNSTHLWPWTSLIRAVCTINRTLEKLQVDGPAGEASAQVLCELIKTNTQLKDLEIWASYSFSHSDIVAIF